MSVTLKRSLIGLALLAALATGCSSSSSPSTPAGTHSSSPAAHSSIPQNNGGDHDGDNNGGPSDGDGNR